MDVANHWHVACELEGALRSTAMLSTSPETERAIVFVHGFGGDAVATWTQFQRLVDERSMEDSWWRNADLYFYGYSSVGQSIGQSAEQLLPLLGRIYPGPDPELFKTRWSPEELQWWGLGPHAARVRDLPAGFRYSDLVLVGHSEGAVLLRWLLRRMAHRYAESRNQQKLDPATLQALAAMPVASQWTLNQWSGIVAALGNQGLPGVPGCEFLYASLRLFAPAIAGAAPSGLLGWLYHGPLSLLIRPFLHSSKAFNDLQPGSTLIQSLRNETQLLAERFPDMNALIAHVLWGSKDRIVAEEPYARDRTSREDTKSHTAVCKPNPSYLRPFAFVKEGCNE